MPTQGQHKHDGNDPRVSRGVNNLDKATGATPGTYRKQETCEENARRHKSNADPVGGPGGKIRGDDTRRD